MKKILIIGGAGFLGFNLAKKLVNRKKFHVTILDNFSRGKKDNFLNNLITDSNNVRLINRDLTKKINQYDLDYEYIFQFAAILGVDIVIDKPYLVLNNNFLIQKNAIDIAKKQKKLKRFIYSSTSEVHLGNQRYKKLTFPTEEKNKILLNDINDSRTSYSLSKIYCESMCHFSELKFTIIRPHNLYGERMGNSHVIPQLISRIKNLKKNQTLYLHSAKHKRCFCYVDDAVNQILALSFSSKSINKTFNIGNNDNEIKIFDLAKLILNLMKRSDIKIKKINKNISSPSKRLPSLKNNFNITKYSNKINIINGCKKVVKWYLEN